MTTAPRWRGNWDNTPAAQWEDAFLTGNGRHGAMVYGDPFDERVVVNHHTLVRPNGSQGLRPPHLAPFLGRIRDVLLADATSPSVAEAVSHAIDGWDLRWVQPFHPAFAIRVRISDTAQETSPDPVAAYRREVDYRTGVVTARWRRDGGEWRSECFVSRADDVVVWRLSAPPGCTITASVTLDPRLPGIPEQVERLGTATSALLRFDARHPGGGDGYRGLTRLIPTGGHVTTRTAADTATEGAEDAVFGMAHAEGCTRLTLLTRVARHTPWPCDSEPPLASLESLPESFDALLVRHLPAHRDAYDRVSLDLGAPREERDLPVATLLARPQRHRLALLERLFDAGRYHLLSSSGMFPPRLTGIWTGEWETAWSGAFTTNANLNLQLASAAVAALPEVSLAHARLVLGQLDDWRSNARLLFGARGVVAPTHTDGHSGHSYHFQRAYPQHLWAAGADWLLHPLLEYVHTTGDDAFLRDRLAPVLAEVATFYEDFLTPIGDGDQVAAVPSYSPENQPANGYSPAAVNATMDVVAARHALLTAADVWQSADPARAQEWRALAERLPALRVNNDGALAEWAWPGITDNYDHRHLSHLYPVWPLDEITPQDTPQLARAAHTALVKRGTENDSAHGYLHTALVAARLHDPELVERPLAALLAGDFFHRSLMSSHYPQRHVYNADAAHTLPAILLEALLHSTPATHERPARVFLLPAAPEWLSTGTLRGARTRNRITVVKLAWDLVQRRVWVVLCSAVDQEVELYTGAPPPPAAPPERLWLRAGEEIALTRALDG
ncbi:glycosyl hydrolase family 95 catalytic domain-containing protein [Salinactinospora qingdaonensis]|uniref:Glycoside hydrolase N-terminal domain-containing protein n=1 Tax=Salinactinospora qingdaonensis TaxID=702744 RepID=A0ABP7G5C2_9ACTN